MIPTLYWKKTRSPVPPKGALIQQLNTFGYGWLILFCSRQLLSSYSRIYVRRLTAFKSIHITVRNQSLAFFLVRSCGTEFIVAPVLSLVKKDPQIRRFNNSDHTFRGPPSDSVSEAWGRLTQGMCEDETRYRNSELMVRFSVYPFSVPNREILEKIGADPDTSVMLPAEYGGGYEGSLGMTHQLHCIVSKCPHARLHKSTPC